MLLQLADFAAWLAPVLLGYALRALKGRIRALLKVKRIERSAEGKLMDPDDTNDPHAAVVSAIVDDNAPAIATMTQRLRRYSTPPYQDPRTNGDHKSKPHKR